MDGMGNLFAQYFAYTKLIFMWGQLKANIVNPGSKKETKIRCPMFTSSIKRRRITWFHVQVVQWTSKKCTKKRNARAELLV